MHDDRAQVEGRLRRFVNERLTPAMYRRTAPLTVTAWQVPDEPVPVAAALAAPYEPYAVGTAWGRPWSTMWLHVTGEVPTDWAGAEVLVDLGFNGTSPGFQSEGLAYRPDGTIIKAVSPYNRYLPVTGATVDFYLEAAANANTDEDFSFTPTVLGDKATAGDQLLYRLNQLELAEPDHDVTELYHDIWTLRGLMEALDAGLPRRAEILRALERMLDAVDPSDVSATAAAGRAELTTVLAAPAYASAHRVVATGHAHIDSAWLWPVRETIRKCARTFANVVALADDNPDFVFACSSAQQLAWMKEYYPELFARITDKVHAGQFVPVGGMWVEADTNLPGGEAMVRQFLQGKGFFQREFGLDTAEVWLPDSFGYSGALPQIAVGAGARWFLGQKNAWNQVNTMPHHTFRWEGIDGTQIFTHFPPVDNYNSRLSGGELAHAQRNYRENGHGTLSLVPFGWGDGGGGPTRDQVAAAHRLGSLEGSPTVRIASPAVFFAEAEAEYADPPVWSGEMYLELHRGTYTSQAATKRGNRRSEHLLREAELWATTAAVRAGVDYPYDEFTHWWQIVLLQQFHDILPGSSIAWVHHDAERNYAAVAAALELIITRSLRALTGDGAIDLVANAAPFDRDGIAALAVGEARPSAAVQVSTEGAGFLLDNGLLRASIDASGHVVSLIDAASGREAIAGSGNHLEVHRDLPNLWDAWDLDEHYRRNVTRITDVISLRQEGSSVVVDRSFGSSQVSQVITLVADALEITTTIDWREREKLIKLGFDLDLRADRSASETQFGHVFRATHRNTSWDAAKFEICAHRWIHVGEPNYGVAVANDATYGHDVTTARRDDGGATTTVRQSLLRSPRYPDPETDQGEHRLVTSVRPGVLIAGAVEEGYRVNLPRRVVRGEHGIEPLISVSDPGVVVEAVKLAEDRSGDLVVRLYESLGQRIQVVLQPQFAVSAVQRTDLLERPVSLSDLAGVDHAGVDHEHGISLTLRPFEIVTLRITPA